MPSITATDWDLFQSLHAVLETGSLSAAARARGVTQPTIGRHIEALEHRLGAPLFLRSSRGFTPTDLALALRPRLEDMAAAAGAALREVAGAADQVGGAVRVTASEMVGCELLPPILADFHAAHPAIEVELTVSNHQADLSRRDADIAVRMARPTQNTLVGRRIGTFDIGLYAAPAYVARCGAPRDFDELNQHPTIGFDGAAPKFDSQIDIGRPITRDIFSFRSDSDVAQLAALRAGLGIGGCQTLIARRYGLVPILADRFRIEMEMWVCMPEGLRTTPRMRLMFDHLVAALSDQLAEAQA
ncbi:LysR family transcriptional regulator [Phenylobacterium sp.]|uniref:LysR family transcriptional regulator n=1 Tax=Phenylobacterium sp. TaxID=1871053 RepID=UPI00272EFD91|nr:LysR family transcriptional regulator [Phenylobacterium sp.]MDP1617722.1 LysR family transcriptional regulator [Phenylobacterium sp.]MDP1989134.1 LysR family transcriptional regulator [Phenylobacterium sp.]